MMGGAVQVHQQLTIGSIGVIHQRLHAGYSFIAEIIKDGHPMHDLGNPLGVRESQRANHETVVLPQGSVA